MGVEEKKAPMDLSRLAHPTANVLPLRCGVQLSEDSSESPTPSRGIIKSLTSLVLHTGKACSTRDTTMNNKLPCNGVHTFVFGFCHCGYWIYDELTSDAAEARDYEAQKEEGNNNAAYG